MYAQLQLRLTLLYTIPQRPAMTWCAGLVVPVNRTRGAWPDACVCLPVANTLRGLFAVVTVLRIEATANCIESLAYRNEDCLLRWIQASVRIRK